MDLNNFLALFTHGPSTSVVRWTSDKFKWGTVSVAGFKECCKYSPEDVSLRPINQQPCFHIFMEMYTALRLISNLAFIFSWKCILPWGPPLFKDQLFISLSWTCILWQNILIFSCKCPPNSGPLLMLFLINFLEWCSVRGVALSTHVWWASFDTDGLCGGFVQVTEEIWVCEKNTITKWEGDIYSYKQQLSHQTRKERAKSIKPWTSSPRCLLLPHASLLEQTSLPSPQLRTCKGGIFLGWGAVQLRGWWTKKISQEDGA